MWYYPAMSSDEKLVKKILLRKNITGEDCARLLILFGYEYHKGSGSHVLRQNKLLPKEASLAS